MSEIEIHTAARTPTVYFIDDSATMREVIKIAFRKENIRVVTCADAASALAQFGETAPDAVITDVIMPGKMNGRQLADEMAKRRSPLKVLFTSGYTENAIIHHGRLDPGVLLQLQPQQRGVALGRVQRGAVGLPGCPEFVGLRQPFRLRQAAGDCGLQHSAFPPALPGRLQPWTVSRAFSLVPSCSLAGCIGDQVLADLDLHVGQPARLGMARHAVVGQVADRVGCVVADRQIRDTAVALTIGRQQREPVADRAVRRHLGKIERDTAHAQRARARVL